MFPGFHRLVTWRRPVVGAVGVAWLVAGCLFGSASCSRESLYGYSQPMPEDKGIHWQPTPSSLLETRPIETSGVGEDGVLDLLSMPHQGEMLWFGWERGGQSVTSPFRLESGRNGGVLRFLLASPSDLELCLEVRPAGDTGAQSLVVLLNGEPMAQWALETPGSTQCVALPADQLVHGPNWLEFDHPDAAGDESRAGAVFDELRIRGFEDSNGPVRARVGLGEGEAESAYLQRGSGSFALLLSLPELAELRMRAARIAHHGSAGTEPALGDVRIVQDSGVRSLWEGELAPGESFPPIRLDLGAFRERAVVLLFRVSDLPDGQEWAWIDPRIVRRAPSELERRGLAPPWASASGGEISLEASPVENGPLGREAPAVEIVGDPATRGREFRFGGFRERADPSVWGGRGLFTEVQPDLDISRHHAVTVFFLTQWRFAFAAPESASGS
ncbi:hypothetical protein MK489_05510 [Myxococcota bacterium]|nr:hypothetical protein [Myxococcota bacterium]